MKSFRKYLAESVHTYNYKIKIAGTPPKNWLDMFIHNLQKFDPVKISNPKSTPIQKDPYGFPGLKDQAITIIDVAFKYPATEPMIKQMARLLNYDENLVRMIASNYDDSINQESEEYEQQASPLLTADYTDMPGAKEAAKAYGDSYLQSIKKQHEEAGDKMEYSYAGERTKDAFDPFTPYVAKDKKAVFGQDNRGPKPATGATSSRG